MALRVGARVGRYEVQPLEGRGGMARVYRARDTKLNRDVALKVLPEHRAFDAGSVARLTAEAQALAALNHPNIASIVTADGQYIVYQDGVNSWRMAADGSGQPSLLVQGGHARVSPDGRWLAYTAGGPTERQVFVTSFPVPGPSTRLSTEGGEDPQWRRDGRELYFVENGQRLMAVNVDAADRWTAGKPQLLFEASFAVESSISAPSYVPAPDGRRFLVLEKQQPEEVLLRVVMNWTARRRQ